MNGLGRRQRRMLVELATVGRGRWPEGWRLRYPDYETLVSLHRHGLVSSADTGAALTESGRRAADRLAAISVEDPFHVP